MEARKVWCVLRGQSTVPKVRGSGLPVDKQFHAERECRTSSDLTALNKRQAKEGMERLRADLKTLGEIKGDGITK